MLLTVLLAVIAALCAGACITWARSARTRLRMVQRFEAQTLEPDYDSREAYVALQLANAGFKKDRHNALLYGLLAVVTGALAATREFSWTSLTLMLAVPAVMSISWWRSNQSEVRIAQERFEIEKRAEETLAQEQLAPRAWAGRLAPDELPDFSGFDVGRVYQAGSGLMAGDFFDVFRVADTRVAAVIGDVAGKGIESSITAFQAKYLLRVFLRQFRDPAQALEELNRQMSSTERGEEFISLVVLVFDTGAGTLRYASAGHPAAWLWHQREVQPLSATGPLVMLADNSPYYSREIPMDLGDMVVMYTDGLAEARSGSEIFGEDRIAVLLKRDPTVAPDVLCKTLLEAARDFSGGPIDDDVAILAIRRA